MGFWSVVGKIAGAAAQGVKNSTEEAKFLRSEWSSASDAFIIQKFKNGSVTERMAAASAFKDRYPDDEERKRAMRDAM